MLYPGPDDETRHDKHAYYHKVGEGHCMRFDANFLRRHPEP